MATKSAGAGIEAFDDGAATINDDVFGVILWMDSCDLKYAGTLICFQEGKLFTGFDLI